jgi:beta-glucosidase-like glycosyl hydrolase
MKMVLGLVPLLSGVAPAKEPAAAVHPALWPQIPPAIAPNAALEARIGKLLGEMTLEQKVGQLIQADIGSITPDDLLHYPLGSILNGGSSAPGNNEFGSPSEWLTLADRFYEASMDASHGPHPIPTMWGTDVWQGIKMHGDRALLTAGEISTARIEDADRRMLRVKLRAHLFDEGRPSSRSRHPEPIRAGPT